MDDLISRQAAIDALNGIINRFEQILRDIRESKVLITATAWRKESQYEQSNLDG